MPTSANEQNIGQSPGLGTQASESKEESSNVGHLSVNTGSYDLNAVAPEDEAARFKAQLQALMGGPFQRYSQKADIIGAPLVRVISDFDQFARTYFEFILQDMDESKASPDPGTPARSRSYELTNALGRLQRQAETLSRASEQRMIPEFAAALKEADAQARQLYDQFKGYKRDSQAVPIAYFEKIFGISRMLYTAYPLVSIPLLASNDPSQWRCGLAHELGHYIYWNSTSLELYREVRPRLQSAVIKALEISNEYNTFKTDVKIAELWVEWLEETFADICATLLVGRVYAASSQQLMEDWSNDLTRDDGDHPLPYLRPLIPIEVMAWVAEQEDAADVRADLEKVVESYREAWAKKQSSVKEKKHQRSGLNVDMITEKLRVVVRTILGGRQNSKSDGLWVRGEKNDPADLGRLIDYTPWLKTLHEPIPALQPIGEPSSPPSSTSFQELLSYLRTKYPAQDPALRQALLMLELDSSEGEIRTTRTVIEVAWGEGNYILAS